MYKGSCLCAEVHVDIEPPIESIIHCHCSKCRKNSGTAYSTNGFVLKQHFHILKGADMLSRYETAPGKCRYFCSKCGSPIYSTSDTTPDYIRLRLGILDSDISERPSSHNFVTSKANWEELEADLPKYSECEPNRARYQRKK